MGGENPELPLQGHAIQMQQEREWV